MRIQRLLAMAALLVCASGTASAQDKGKVGFTMGYPGAIGIQWHVSDKVAIRPEFSFSFSSSESDAGTFETEGDSWTFGTNISALFYLSTDDKLRTYFAPRFSWSHASTTSEMTGVNIPVTVVETESKSTGDAYSGAGSFGAQYGLGDRFLVFGEFGVSFGRATSESNQSSRKTTTTAWGTRTAVGIVFFP